ncbi:type 4a pilus biogenesis protein PilO [Pleionea litopenaei]|uniref:Type 4a pilus biogenesis protein PilO n=1 Tax=Pleionea litopenaei TaxID=3070815 RepID=A0AA51X632_9GAMM|nr:type 4a pilus biogenesis protein PilO [Pleionea sp. HL-JVS1]WMS86454.1 type 4a pilus biogenesis protein PilO [Pleionea sp. HL-JVS1]
MSSMKDFDVSDLDINNMGVWPTPVKVITGILVFGLVLLLGYQFFISDDLDALEAERGKEFRLKQDFEKKQRKAVHLEDYKNQMASIKKAFEGLLKQLPQRSEVPGLVDEISYAVTGAGLELENISLKGEVSREIYFEEPLEINVSGGYHQIADFVSRVSNMPRIVTLHDFTIRTTDREVFGSEGEKMLVMTVTAKTYRYAEVGEDQL